MKKTTFILGNKKQLMIEISGQEDRVDEMTKLFELAFNSDEQFSRHTSKQL